MALRQGCDACGAVSGGKRGSSSSCVIVRRGCVLPDPPAPEREAAARPAVRPTPSPPVEPPPAPSALPAAAVPPATGAAAASHSASLPPPPQPGSHARLGAYCASVGR
eukprot:357827-Chlamydomonas_euryale.AAC.3